MLVLSRKIDEVTRIILPDGRQVTVMIVDIRYDKVRLGFEADNDIVIDREEIYLAKQEKKHE